MDSLAKAAPHRPDRSPERWILSRSWRALNACPCGEPYCWYELVKEQRSPLGAPSGNELLQDLLHVLQVLALESCGQAPQQGRLSRRQPPAALLIPVRHPDATAIPAADRLDGVAKREHFDVAANGPLAHPQLCCQVWDSLLSPLAEQVQYQLSPLRRAHGLTPLSLPCPDSTG